MAVHFSTKYFIPTSSAFSASSSTLFNKSFSHPFFHFPEKMSCSNGNCSCGSSCGCGSGCGCSRSANIESFVETTTTQTLISGVAPAKMISEGTEMSFGSENGCKCGDSCSCDPCTC